MIQNRKILNFAHLILTNMKRFSLRLILSFLLLSPGLIYAGPIDDLIKKAGTAKDFPKDQQILIFDSTRVDVQPSGLSHFYIHRLHKVLNEKGALNLNVVKFDYDPLSAYAEIKKVTIYRANGTKEDLDTKKVLDYPAPARAIYWGAREIMLNVGRLEPGDALEIELFKKGFTYALLQGDDEERFIPPMKGHFYDIVPFYNDFPILSKVYILSLPKDKTLQYEFYNGEASVSQSIKGDRIVYSWSKKQILPIKSEPGMVDKSDVAPKLLMSTNPDWETKSLWFFGVNEDFGSFVFTPAITAKVREILKNARNEDDSISLLTHWCADEIRYSGLSMGKGEGFTLHKGEMTFADRCGVCKDKAGMLITMLRAAGFQSYPAMTMAGSRIDYVPADQFNHCVTVVKRKNGQYQLLDPTWVPFLRELWSSAEQQQNYLMGIPEGADLGITPISSPENHYFRLTGKSVINIDGSLTGSFTLTAEGQTDAAVRRFFTSGLKEQWKMQMERELLKVAPRAQLISLDYGDPYAYLQGPISINFNYRIPEYAVVGASEIIFVPFLASELFKSVQSHLSTNTSPEERKYPFRDRCSRLVEINEIVTVPAGYQMVSSPASTDLKGTAASFTASVTQTGNSIILYEKGRFEKRVYEASDWPDYKAAVQAQKNFANEAVVLKTK